MDTIINAIVEWLKGVLVDGIMGNLDGLFNNVNEQVGGIASQVGTTPADFNAGVFSMIRQISETVVLPIAGIILTFVMTYELIQMLIDRNNLHDIDTWMFFKWIFKTFVAVTILTNTFNIVLAVFDVSQHVIQQSAGLIQSGTEITPDIMDSLRTDLEAMELGPLFGLFLQSFLVQFTMTALNIVIFVIVYGRMIEIYLLTSLAPIPFSTVANRDVYKRQPQPYPNTYTPGKAAYRAKRQGKSTPDRTVCSGLWTLSRRWPRARAKAMNDGRRYTI